jgi:cytochrome c oxidase assembly protein subunit 11
MTARQEAETRASQRKNTRVAAYSAGFALFMLGMAYAAVPLYQVFCQVTGFGGTTQRAEAPSGKTVDRMVTVRFDSNVSGGLGWTFKPVQRTMNVQIGENALAFYRATNTSDKPVVGTATFNVAPFSVGAYFAKIECFCFTEQRLEPGQSVEMPVSFYVDPEFVNDKDTRGIQEITLSYTFYPVDKPKEQGETKSNQASLAPVSVPTGDDVAKAQPRG